MIRATILRHRDIVRLSIGRVPMGPNALRYRDRVLAILCVCGASDQLAVLGHHSMISIVNGFTADETGGGGRAATGQPAPRQVAGGATVMVVSLATKTATTKATAKKPRALRILAWLLLLERMSGKPVELGNSNPWPSACDPHVRLGVCAGQALAKSL